MTEEITNLVIEIGEQVGAVVTYDSLKPNPTLRRESRIRSIYSSYFTMNLNSFIHLQMGTEGWEDFGSR